MKHPRHLLLLPLLLSSCIVIDFIQLFEPEPPPPPTLPAETQEGLDTLNRPNVEAWLSDENVVIRARDFYDDEYFILELEFGIPTFTIPEDTIYVFQTHDLGLNVEVVTTDPNLEGAGISYAEDSYVLFTRVDGASRILSGKFEIDILTERGRGDTIRVRDGRFDVIVR